MLLIGTWRELSARWPALHLVIVGTGHGSFDDCEVELAEYVRANGIADRVQLVGPSNAVHEYLQAADLCVYPSEYEGFGIGIIEALGCGIPLAVTPVGVAQDLVRQGETGFLFPVNDREALIGSIDSILQQRTRWPEIGARAREAVAPYALAAIVAQFAGLCRTLTGREAAGTGREAAS